MCSTNSLRLGCDLRQRRQDDTECAKNGNKSPKVTITGVYQHEAITMIIANRHRLVVFISLKFKIVVILIF